MKKTLCILLSLVMCIGFIACGQQSDDGKFNIVVTAFPHYDFARSLTSGLENVQITMLLSPGSEVHTYEPTPKDILAINNCDLFIYTGGESEKWANDMIKDSDINVISFMDICQKLEIEQDGHDEHGHEYDEHVWTSPKNAVEICKEISKELCTILPDNKQLLENNLKEYLSKLYELDGKFENVMSEKSRDYIIVGDRFPFLHLANTYDIQYYAAFSGCSSSTEPSAKTISTLSNLVKRDKIPYIFIIEFSNEKVADSIADGKKCEKLLLHSCHNVSKEDFDGGTTYIDLMTQNCDNLRKALCE